MERRTLRRAADQALLTSLGNPADRPGGAPDRDFTYTRAAQERPKPVVETSAPAYDQDPITAPIPVFNVPVLPPSVPPWEYDSVEDVAEPADVYDLVPETPKESVADEHIAHIAAPVATAAAVTEPPRDYRWIERDDGVVAPSAQPLRARPVAEVTYVRPELDFAKSGYGTQQWHRTKPAAAVLAAALVAAVLCGGWLVFRSPGSTAQESQTTAPTSDAPSSGNTAPTAVSAPRPKPEPAPLPPPPPPPPPPPAEPTYSAPQRQYSPRYSEPTPAQKPRVDVTRAPMSVAPVPKPVPGSDSATPGDAPGEKPRRRGCFGFC